MVLLAVALVVLIALAALVIDLGRTYVVRTELQNAADAMALAGAKELNKTVAGVTRASDFAMNMAKQHRFDFSTPLITGTTENVTFALSVGNCPDDTGCNWTPVANIATDADAADKTFLKVEIQSPSLLTYFATYFGVTGTGTYGRAVAGRYLLKMAPIGVCALRNADGTTRTESGEVLSTSELAQYGFRRGVSYNIFELGPLGAPSDPYLLNPVDSYPGACDPNNSSASVTAPFICSGVSAAVPSKLPAYVYGNTGVSAGQVERALNSRFDIYGSGSSAVCSPAVEPPDTNVTAFAYTPSVNVDWMSPQPTRQTMLPPGAPKPTDGLPSSAGGYGVLSSYSRAVAAVGTTPNATAGDAYAPTTANWATLYPVAGGGTAPVPALAASSPYETKITPPSPSHPGEPGRRIVNLAIADCNDTVGSGACSGVKVLAVGKFFMQVPADFSGSPKKLQVEFAGLIDPPVAEIKLFR